MSSATAAIRKNFKAFGSKDVAGAAILDEPLDDRSALAMELLAAPKDVKAYRPRHPVTLVAETIVYPSLLQATPTLQMARAELENEIRLLLERRQEAAFGDDTYVYSIRALDPVSFQPSTHLESVIASLPLSFANNVRVGYLTHDALYGLLADEGRLVSVLDAFLREVKEVEVKVRRAPEEQREVRVTLES